MMGAKSTDKFDGQMNSQEKEYTSKVVNGDAVQNENVIIPSSVGHLVGSVTVDESEEWKGKELNLGSKFRILKRTDQIWEFQTVIRGTNNFFNIIGVLDYISTVLYLYQVSIC